MSDLQNLQAGLAKARLQNQQSQQDLLLLKALKSRKERELRELQRGRKPNDQAYLSKESALANAIESIGKQLDNQRERIGSVKADLGGLKGSLLQLGDPTEQIGQFPSAVPFLLFPVRVETRFKLKANENRPNDELWVRFFPDDCQVNAFEPLLRESEISTGKAFWAQYWAAAGDETRQRSAWKALCASSGSGRAAWIVKTLVPSNPADEPNAGGDGSKVFLVLYSEAGLTATEESAAMDFWASYWKANGDVPAQDAAFSVLSTAIGAEKADLVLKSFVPVNISDEPATGTRADAVLAVVRQYFAGEETLGVVEKSWNQAPKAALMPDRFVVTLYHGSTVRQVMGGGVSENLAVGVDPSLAEADQMKMVNGDLVVNEDLLWMTDFNRACDVGMGMKIELSATEASRGFDRLTVLGLRLSADHLSSQLELEQLLEDHYHSRQGFSFVPQGSATNNTEDEGSAYSWKDDPDFAFDIVFGRAESNVPAVQASAVRDGEYFSAYLGLDSSRIGKLPHSNGRDQAEAQAMNTALWPATLGYFMEELTGELFTDEDREFAEKYFVKWVSGRGPIPAVRVGSQPYGILPITTFRDMQMGRGVKPGGNLTHNAAPSLDALQHARLHAFLKKLELLWDDMAKNVAHVGKRGDPQQVLLDVLGLHHGSVEYHQRYSETMLQLYNTLKLQGSDFLAALLVGLIAAATKQMGTELGIPEDKLAMKILEIFHKTDQDKLVGAIVDSQELSEENPVEEYATGLNYLDWLATSNLDTIRKMDFGSGISAPTSLLFLFLRHAMLMSHHDASVRILAKAKQIDLKVAKQPADFIHIEAGKSAEKAVSVASKFEPMYAQAPAFTNHANKTIAEYLAVPGIIENLAEAARLAGARKAISFLADTPTAQLERLFAEHIDTVSYRLDAWKTGMTAERILEARAAQQHTLGIQLGCYAFLENLRPDDRKLSPLRLLDQELLKDFGQMGRIMKDSENGGYIHAPSLNHATTAAILKNAYAENASPANTDTMAVNISSERVRNALTVLEGIRNGQTLGALLGYRFERGLHDAHNLAEVDKFIYPLRKKFGLVADKLTPTKTDASIPLKLSAARNVLDGVRLATHVRGAGGMSYPFGIATGTGASDLPVATAAEKAAIDAEVQKLLDLNDAVSDLVMAENIYQVVRGNFEKAAAISQAFSEGKYPHEPEVVKTPRSGTGLTHRAALHFNPLAPSPNVHPLTPRCTAEPGLHAWVCGVLPAAEDIVASVTYSHPGLAVSASTTVTLAQIGLQPTDLLYVFNLELDQAMSALDDRILQFVRYDASLSPHPGLKIEIHYSSPVAGKVSFFEVASLVRSLRGLLLGSRHLGAEDIALTQTATSSDIAYDLNELATRVSNAITSLDALRLQLEALETDGSDLDAFVAAVSTAFQQVAAHGIPGSGTANLHEGIRLIHAGLVTKISDLVTRWQAKVVTYNTLMAGYAALTTEEERFALLLEAEAQVLSTTTAVLPATAALFKVSVEASKALFDAALLSFQAQAATTASTLTAYLSTLGGMVVTAALHDAVPLDFTTENGDGTAEKPGTVAAHRAAVLAQLSVLADDVAARCIKAADLVTQAAASTETNASIRLLMEAAKAVLGDEIKLLPRFSLSATQATEMSNGLGATGALTNYLVTSKNRRFPVDDWFYGLARVRKKFSDWENVRVLSEAFGGSNGTLSPLQFPYALGDSWLALEIPETYVHKGEHLLYTAEFPAGYSAAGAQCGLLLDEWTEVIPTKEETTGVVFHYDQPNQEPGQSWLLVTPASLNANWTWEELINGVNSALDEAKARAVEPDQIDKTPLGQFLPATLMAVTLYQITIATNLLQNNLLYTQLKA